jgi:hypothetical protein
MSKLAALRGFVPLANWYARQAETVEGFSTTEQHVAMPAEGLGISDKAKEL